MIFEVDFDKLSKTAREPKNISKTVLSPCELSILRETESLSSITHRHFFKSNIKKDCTKLWEDRQPWEVVEVGVGQSRGPTASLNQIS